MTDRQFTTRDVTHDPDVSNFFLKGRTLLNIKNYKKLNV